MRDTRGSGFRALFGVLDLGFRERAMANQVDKNMENEMETTNPDRLLINPLPLIGIILGIQILRPLKGGGSLITGLHYMIHWDMPLTVAVLNAVSLMVLRISITYCENCFCRGEWPKS